MKYALVLLTAGLFSLSAMARMPGPDQMVEHLTTTLNLTDEQVEQVSTIMNSRQNEMKALMAKLAALHTQTNSEIKAILTEEQQQKFETLQSKREHHRKHGAEEF